jgi:nucleotide-binding universal stress UspA family protein
MATFAKILVCVDGSEFSMKAADYALMLAEQNDAHVIALNVIVSYLGYARSAPAFGLVAPSAINDLIEKSKQEAQGRFDDIGKKAAEKGVKLLSDIIVSPTSVVPAIVDYEDRNKVDLIVVGTRGRSGFTKLLLGSVASGVVTYASCPVMVIK